MDYVHYRHRDAQTGNGQGADSLAYEHPVCHVVDGRNNLTDYGGEGVDPEQHTYLPGFKFFCIVHLKFGLLVFHSVSSQASARRVIRLLSKER